MIIYELVKELKDAGFPQNNNHYYCMEDGAVSDVCIPSLSELIEACGDNFEKLIKGKDGFFAIPPMKYSIENEYTAYHVPTPEEAVAYLWLQLNKKINYENTKSSSNS